MLARAVLRGQTRGYRHPPQLQRFREHPSPRAAICAYLATVHAEATARGYAFDRKKVGPVRKVGAIPVSAGQMRYEWKHLRRKLSLRSPAQFEKFRRLKGPDCHPLFRRRPGPVEDWERT